MQRKSLENFAAEILKFCMNIYKGARKDSKKKKKLLKKLIHHV